MDAPTEPTTTSGDDEDEADLPPWRRIGRRAWEAGRLTPGWIVVCSRCYFRLWIAVEEKRSAAIEEYLSKRYKWRLVQGLWVCRKCR